MEAEECGGEFLSHMGEKLNPLQTGNGYDTIQHRHKGTMYLRR